MIRFIVGLLILMTFPGVASAQAPDAATAKQSFDQLQQKWAGLRQQIAEMYQEKAAGDEPDPKELDSLLQQAEATMGQITQAGLAVYRADAKKYPEVNNILTAIARFYVLGDPQGDGGDQYEKALPVIQAMLDADTGSASSELWLLGGVSAFQLNEFDLAKKYLDAAEQADLLPARPPGRRRDDPRNRIWQLAKKAQETLFVTRGEWTKESQIRAAEAKADDLPRVKFTTSRGEVIIELFENEAPEAVANFITLVKQGFYDGVVFHRVLPGFMAQGGDPQGTGRGGPGYHIRCECHQATARKHFRGSLSMAHAGRNTGGSQFFLTFITTSGLDGVHTVFGRVIEGMDVAASLKRRDPDAPGPKPTPDKIVKAEVLRDRGHAYEFKKLPGR